MIMLPVDEHYITGTLAGLVRINSINPAFARAGEPSDESRIARHVGSLLQELGCEVTYHEPLPGRVSVTGRLVGTGGGRSLLIYAHMDTVGVEGMTSDPFEVSIRDGKLYGRGAYDMKCGLAAALGAVKALRDGGVRLAGDVVVCGVADEETESIGMQDVLTRVRTDGAIVTEPTELQLCIAHKGFCWIEVETLGRAAHGSRYEDGVDANMHMGRFLAALGGLEQRLRQSPPHRLVGPPSLHAAVVHGGTGTSTYAARCRLEIERRTIPGESPEHAMAQIGELLASLARQDPAFNGRHRLLLSREAFEVARDAPVSKAVLAAATEELGHAPAIVGVAYWMDAALLAAAGIETVVIGATGTGAHAAEEWVDLASTVSVARILASSAMRYCGSQVT
ncbi:MAG: M20/M25/M40 family metallo-hydrolase [Gemmatimonadaceae bacterium]